MSENGRVTKRDTYIKREVVPRKRIFSPTELDADLYLITPMSPWAKLFRRQFLEKNALRFPALKRSEDFPFVQLAMSLSNRLGVLPQTIFDRRVGVATSLESTKDETPLIFAEAEDLFIRALAERGLLDDFKYAANASFVANLAYNLRKICRFSSFTVIARYCAKTFPKLTAEEKIKAKCARFERDARFVAGVVADANSPEALAGIFADIHAKDKAGRAAPEKKRAADAFDGPDISVIIPIYNTEQYLDQCLDSVANQTLRNIEIVCVDDGSSDRSVEIAEKHAASDSRITVVRQRHEGVGSARNKGLSLAKGEYVYFLDSDDWIDGNALERLLELARREDLDQVLFAAEVHMEGFDVARNSLDVERFNRMARSYEIPNDIAGQPMSGVDMALAFIERNVFNVLGALRLIRCDVLRNHEISYPTGIIHEDEFFVAALCTASGKVVAVQDKYFHRRLRSGSIMTAQDNAIEHLRGYLTVARLMNEYSQTHFAEGTRGWELLFRRRCVMERLALNYLGEINAETLPAEFKDDVLSICIKWHGYGRRPMAPRGKIEEHMTALKVSLSKARREREAALKERDAIKNTLVAVRGVRDAALKERDTLKNTLEAVRAVRDGAIKERDTQSRVLAEVREVRDAALKERDTLKNTLEAVRAVRDGAIKERDTLKNTLEAVRAVRDGAIKERDTLKNTLDAVRAVRDKALAERDSLKQSLDAVRNVRNAAFKERDMLTNALEAVRAVRDDALKKCDTLKTTIETMRNARDAAIRELDTLKKTMDEVCAKRDDAMKERDMLKNNLDAVRNVRDAALKERDMLKKVLTEVRKVRDEALKQRDSLRKTLEASQSKCDTVILERDSLRSNLETLTAKCNAMHSELSSIKELQEKIVSICA